MNTNQHLFKYWEAWLIRPDARYNRYVGFEFLPTGGFCVCQRQLHDSAHDEPPDPNTVLALRQGLDVIHNQPGVSKQYNSIYEAVAMWDANHPESRPPSPTGVLA